MNWWIVLITTNNLHLKPWDMSGAIFQCEQKIQWTINKSNIKFIFVSEIASI